MFANSEVDDFLTETTFGMEIDLNTADRNISLPNGYTYCPDETNAHTTCGISVDPKLEFNMFGGEVQMKPTNTEQELYDNVFKIAALVCPDGVITSPAGLHLHVRIPALLERPDVLRHLLVWGQKWDKQIFSYVFPKRTELDPGKFTKKGFVYHKWLDMSKYWGKVLPYRPCDVRRANACKSNQVTDIVHALHNFTLDMKAHSWTDPHQHTTFRPTVNYGHININETIEFRSFVATLDRIKLKNIVEFPLKYLRVALTNDADPLKIVRNTEFLNYYDHGSEKESSMIQTNRGETSLYLQSRDVVNSYINSLFISGKITLADLNFPQYWIDRGYQ